MSKDKAIENINYVIKRANEKEHFPCPVCKRKLEAALAELNEIEQLETEKRLTDEQSGSLQERCDKLLFENKRLKAFCLRESQVLEEALKRIHNKSMIKVVADSLEEQALKGKKMKTRYKHIHFKKAIDEYRDNTSYICLNNKSKNMLGRVFYYQRWKRWCFLTKEDDITFDSSCLADIQHFIDQLNTEAEKCRSKRD